MIKNKKLFWLKQEIIYFQFQLEEGLQVIFQLYHFLVVGLIDLYIYQNIVQRRKSLIKA